MIRHISNGFLLQRRSAGKCKYQYWSTTCLGTCGYDYVNYYYLPDHDVYYDVPRGMFVYLNLGRWTFGRTLPARYHYDLYRSYKVVINDRDPWLRNNYYRSRYAAYRGRHQYIIRDSRDDRYIAAREHDRGRGHVTYNNREERGHDRYRSNKGNGKWNNGHGKGKGHGNDRGGRGKHH